MRCSSMVPLKRMPGRILAGSVLSSLMSTCSTFTGSRVFFFCCTVVPALVIVP